MVHNKYAEKGIRMAVVIGVLVAGLIGAVGFGSYMWADAKASRRLVAWNERTNPSTVVIQAIKDTQEQSNAAVATIASTIAASVKSMMGMDREVVQYDPVPVYAPEDEPVIRPFAEMDRFMNDDVDIQTDEMRPDYAL